MRPASINTDRPRTDQRGAILVTSMLLLLVLTIIGVTVMQMSRMQERMAGNTRDVNLAFQAAEAGLRISESFIRQQMTRPISCTSTPCQVWADGAITGTIANKDDTWWLSNGQTFGLAAMAGVKQPPTAAVEELGFVRTDGGVVMGQEPPDGRDFYQVTARSTGGSGLTDLVLQTTYTRKF